MPRHKMVTTRGSRFCSLRRRRYSGSGLRKRARADSRADSLSPSDFNLSSRVEALPILASLGAESCTSISLLRRSNCEVRARLNASSASWRRLRSPVSSAGSSLTEGGWALLAAASGEGSARPEDSRSACAVATEAWGQSGTSSRARRGRDARGGGVRGRGSRAGRLEERLRRRHRGWGPIRDKLEGALVQLGNDAVALDEAEGVDIGRAVAHQASSEFGEPVCRGARLEGDDDLKLSKAVHADDDRRPGRSAGAGSLLKHLLDGKVGVAERNFGGTTQSLVEFVLALQRLLVGSQPPHGIFARPLLLQRVELPLMLRAEYAGTILKHPDQHDGEHQRGEYLKEGQPTGGASLHGW